MEVIVQCKIETGQVLTARKTHENMHFEEEESFSTMFGSNFYCHTAPAQPCGFDSMTYRHVTRVRLKVPEGRFRLRKEDPGLAHPQFCHPFI